MGRNSVRNVESSSLTTETSETDSCCGLVPKRSEMTVESERLEHDGREVA